MRASLNSDLNGAAEQISAASERAADRDACWLQQFDDLRPDASVAELVRLAGSAPDPFLAGLLLGRACVLIELPLH